VCRRGFEQSSELVRRQRYRRYRQECQEEPSLPSPFAEQFVLKLDLSAGDLPYFDFQLQALVRMGPEFGDPRQELLTLFLKPEVLRLSRPVEKWEPCGHQP
jgi:hypothetical protein